MFKSYFLLFFIILSFGLYGQKSTLLQNKNFRANELKHNLNKEGDTLILESKKTIYSVEIFNQDYTKSINIDSTKAKIALNDTPLGRLVVQAKLVDKRIIMTLLRHKDFDEITNETKEDNIVTTPQPKKQGVSSLLNWKSKKSKANVEKFYWAIQESNSGSNSYKSMKLVSTKELLKMIQKNKVEVNTEQGKFNKLTVWEVYDTAKFMEKQVANPEYVFSTTSSLFNTTPYFSSIGNAKFP
ncbi:hypothetical protein [Winogradskyella sp. PE311]|uniref:hypothetical protein n=1 Tax=Winogradskyella sp. PE311 TaxID=3366943 RepID=UPI0039809C61